MEYILIYTGIGLFFAGSVLFHSRKKFSNITIMTFVFSFFFWPVIIMMLSSDLVENEHDNESYKKEDILKKKATEYLLTEGILLSSQDKNRIERVAKYGYNEVYIFSDSSDFQDIINKLWDFHVHPKIYSSYLNSIRYFEEDYNPNLEPRFSIQAPGWYVGFSNEFVKSISKIDRKKQGRILESIEKIASAPTEIKGDTIKPLTGDLNGLWRCRIGDDRLIYFPDIENKKVVLITFSTRGEVYKNVPNIKSLLNE